MRWLGTRTVRFSELRLPGDFERRQREQHIRDRVESLRDVGMINLPVVEWRTKTLVAGVDRVAALHLAHDPRQGELEFYVRAFEGDELEMERISIRENLDRRHDNRDALRARLVELTERQLAAAPREPDPEPTRGREKTARGRAREAVARELGTTPEALRKAEERAAAQAEATREEDAPIHLHGLRLPDEDMDLVRAIVETLTGIERHLRSARTSLAALASVMEAAPAPHRKKLDVQELQRALEEATRVARASKPTDACVYCKLVRTERKRCAACAGAGYVVADQMRHVPPELLVEGEDAGIYVAGRSGPVFRRLSELAP